MGIDYKVNGTLKLKNDIRVRALIEELQRILVGEGPQEDGDVVGVEGPIDNKVVVYLAYNNYGSSSLPDKVEAALAELEAFMLEPAKLEFMEGVEEYERWVGPKELIEKFKSLDALSQIADLLPTLRVEEFAHLRALCDTYDKVVLEQVTEWWRKVT